EPCRRPPPPPGGLSAACPYCPNRRCIVDTPMRRLPLSLQIVIGMGLGLCAGPLLGPSAAPLGELGKILIQLIKGVATPLLFFAIVNAILKSEVRGRQGLTMLGFALFNSCIALAIGLLLSNLFQPGRLLDIHGVTQGPAAAAAFTDKKIDVIKTITG